MKIDIYLEREEYEEIVRFGIYDHVLIIHLDRCIGKFKLEPMTLKGEHVRLEGELYDELDFVEVPKRELLESMGVEN